MNARAKYSSQKNEIFKQYKQDIFMDETRHAEIY